MYVWKVPAVHGPTHVGLVTKAVNECRDSAPKQMSQEAIRHFNSIINQISEIPKGVTDALQNYIFHGDANPDDNITDEYLQFVLYLAAGQPIDEAMLADGRIFNSCGGKGIDAIQFEDFWDACRQVLLPNSAK